MSFLRAQMIGNLGRNPELRFTPQGDAVCDFSVAVNEKDKNGVESTQWIKVVCWRRTAENASKYLVKGGSAFFEGSIKNEEWTDRDGKARVTMVMNCTNLQFLPRQFEVTGDDSDIGKSHSKQSTPSDFDEEIGF